MLEEKKEEKWSGEALGSMRLVSGPMSKIRTYLVAFYCRGSTTE